MNNKDRAERAKQTVEFYSKTFVDEETEEEALTDLVSDIFHLIHKKHDELGVEDFITRCKSHFLAEVDEESNEE